MGSEEALSVLINVIQLAATVALLSSVPPPHLVVASDMPADTVLLRVPPASGRTRNTKVCNEVGG